MLSGCLVLSFLSRHMPLPQAACPSLPLYMCIMFTISIPILINLGLGQCPFCGVMWVGYHAPRPKLVTSSYLCPLSGNGDQLGLQIGNRVGATTGLARLCDYARWAHVIQACGLYSCAQASIRHAHQLAYVQACHQLLHQVYLVPSGVCF